MCVFFKSLSGHTESLRVNYDEKISSVKDKFQYHFGIPPAYIKFIFAGKELEDEKRLNDYNIMRESTIHAPVRIRGD